MSGQYDGASVLEIDDYQAVRNELFDLAGTWSELALDLGLSCSDVKALKEANCGDPSRCLDGMIEKWLTLDYNYQMFGLPTWDRLAVAVKCRNRGCNHVPAKLMAHMDQTSLPIVLDSKSTHQAMSSLENESECIVPSENKSFKPYTTELSRHNNTRVSSSCPVHEGIGLKTLLNDLARMDYKWFSIGMALGVPVSQLNKMKGEGGPIGLNKVISYWLSNASEPRKKDLVDMLRSNSIGERRLARELENDKAINSSRVLGEEDFYGIIKVLAPVSDRWDDIAIQLDIDTNCIKTSASNCNNGEALRMVLEELELINPAVTVHDLVQALSSPVIAEKRYAKEIQQKYCSGNMESAGGGSYVHDCMPDSLESSTTSHIAAEATGSTQPRPAPRHKQMQTAVPRHKQMPIAAPRHKQVPSHTSEQPMPSSQWQQPGLRTEADFTSLNSLADDKNQAAPLSTKKPPLHGSLDARSVVASSKDSTALPLQPNEGSIVMETNNPSIDLTLMDSAQQASPMSTLDVDSITMKHPVPMQQHKIDTSIGSPLQQINECVSSLDGSTVSDVLDKKTSSLSVDGNQSNLFTTLPDNRSGLSDIYEQQPSLHSYVTAAGPESATPIILPSSGFSSSTRQINGKPSLHSLHSEPFTGSSTSVQLVSNVHESPEIRRSSNAVQYLAGDINTEEAWSSDFKKFVHSNASLMMSGHGAFHTCNINGASSGTDTPFVTDTLADSTFSDDMKNTLNYDTGFKVPSQPATGLSTRSDSALPSSGLHMIKIVHSDVSLQQPSQAAPSMISATLNHGASNGTIESKDDSTYQPTRPSILDDKNPSPLLITEQFTSTQLAPNWSITTNRGIDTTKPDNFDFRKVVHCNASLMMPGHGAFDASNVNGGFSGSVFASNNPAMTAPFDMQNGVYFDKVTLSTSNVPSMSGPEFIDSEVSLQKSPQATKLVGLDFSLQQPCEENGATIQPFLIKANQLHQGPQQSFNGPVSIDLSLYNPSNFSLQCQAPISCSDSNRNSSSLHSDCLQQHSQSSYHPEVTIPSSQCNITERSEVGQSNVSHDHLSQNGHRTAVKCDTSCETISSKVHHSGSNLDPSSQDHLLKHQALTDSALSVNNGELALPLSKNKLSTKMPSDIDNSELNLFIHTAAASSVDWVSASLSTGKASTSKLVLGKSDLHSLFISDKAGTISEESICGPGDKQIPLSPQAYFIKDMGISADQESRSMASVEEQSNIGCSPLSGREHGVSKSLDSSCSGRCEGLLDPSSLRVKDDELRSLAIVEDDY